MDAVDRPIMERDLLKLGFKEQTRHHFTLTKEKVEFTVATRLMHKVSCRVRGRNDTGFYSSAPGAVQKFVKATIATIKPSSPYGRAS